MTVLFADGVPEIFSGLPAMVKLSAARSIDLLVRFPHMFPVRRRGIMRGYRYFAAGRFLFYYIVSTTEVRISAIIPAAMKLS